LALARTCANAKLQAAIRWSCQIVICFSLASEKFCQI
jgi:hypothetical protein